MLIIKKYQDYYDTAIGFGGIDKTCIWERTPEQEKEPKQLKAILKLLDSQDSENIRTYMKDERIFRSSPYRDGSPELILPFIIGFCGKTYVGYVFRWTQGYDHTIKIVYGKEAFLELHSFDRNSKIDKENTITFFDRYHNKPHTELFFKYRVPVWVYDWGTDVIKYENYFGSKFHYHIPYFMTNPPLKDYEFYRLFSAPQAFQEIQMYLQGVLGNKEKEIVEISEKDKLLQHGFDKWSFRNPYPPKRKRKCKI